VAGELPAPVSVTDELLAKLIGEVRGLRSDLQELRPNPQPGAAPGRTRAAAAGGEVELTEPKPPRARAKKKA
jgi:hypothetical protein